MQVANSRDSQQPVDLCERRRASRRFFSQYPLLTIPATDTTPATLNIRGIGLAGSDYRGWRLAANYF